MPGWLRAWGCVGLVVAVAMAAGLPATRLPFGGDDQYILARAASPRIADRFAVYTAEAPGPLSQRIGAWWMGLEYRRVFVRIAPSVLIAVERSLFGISPWPYHFASLLLHATNAALLFLLARRLAASGALIGALAFAAHPAVSEMVSWLAVTGTLVGTSFMLAALHAATGPSADAQDEPGTRAHAWRSIRCVLATALAVTSYESMVALPLVLVGLGHAGVLPTIRRRPVSLALLAILPLYAGLRLALGTTDLSLGPTFPRDEVLPLLFGDTAAYVARALGANKAHAIWLHGSAPLAVTVPVVIVTLVPCVYLARRHRAAALGLAAAVFLLAPPVLVRATVGVLNWPTYRQVYPALVGFALIAAAAVPPIKHRASQIAAHGASAIVPLALTWSYGPSATLWAQNVDKLSAATRAASRDAPANALVLWVGAPVFFPYSITYDWPARGELYLVPPPRGGASIRVCTTAAGEVVVQSSEDPLASALLPSGDRLLGRLRRAQRATLPANGELDLSRHLARGRASVRREGNTLSFSFDRPPEELVVLEVKTDLSVRRLAPPAC